MGNTLGIIEYADRPWGDPPGKKAIFIPCKCKWCGKVTIRKMDCPEHLQPADPGYVVYVDPDGQLQARRDP